MSIHGAGRTRALACLIEQAGCTKIQHSLKACRHLYPTGKTDALALPCGGVAGLAMSVPDIQRINHACGLAMNGDPVDEASVRMIEDLYFSHGLPTIIIIFPWVPSAALQVLAARGFSASFFINTYVCSLEDTTDAKKRETPSVVSISIMKQSQYEGFIKYSAAGFNGGVMSNEQNESVARLATLTPKKLLYLATVDGIAAGTSMMQFFDTESGELVAYSGLTSTLPGFRGRGVASALASVQLKDAKRNGCRWIYSMGEVGNKNAEVQERLGFRLLHTKPVFAKMLPKDKAN